MKYCKKCGTPNDDFYRICRQCGFDRGASVKPATVQIPDPAPNSTRGSFPMQVFIQPTPASTPYTDSRNTSAINVIREIKRIGSGGAMLFTAIAFSVMIFISIINIFSYNNSSDILMLLSSQNEYVYDMFGSSLSTSASIIGFLGLIPDIIIFIGLWVTFFEFGSTGSNCRTAGLTMISVIIWMRFAKYCIVTILLVIGAIATGSATNSSDISLIFLLIIIIVCTPVLMYYALIAKSINTVSNAMRSGLSGTVSVFVVVANLIIAFIEIISIIVIILGKSLLNDIIYSFNLPSQIISTVLNTFGVRSDLALFSNMANLAVLIGSSILMISYNSRIPSAYYSPTFNAKSPY